MCFSFQLSESSPPNSPYKLSVTSSSDSISSCSGADTTSSSGVNTVKSVSPDGATGEGHDDDDNSSEVLQLEIPNRYTGLLD